MALALQVGVIVDYQLRSSQYPTDPHQIRHGKVLSMQLNAAKTSGIVGVESVESGYEGYTEDIFLSQILTVEE